VDSADDVFDPHLRLYEIAIGTERFPACPLIFAGECGHHDNFDIFCFSSRTQNIQHIETADLRHHDIANNELRSFLNRHSQGLFPVASRYDVIPFSKKPHAVDLT